MKLDKLDYGEGYITEGGYHVIITAFRKKVALGVINSEPNTTSSFTLEPYGCSHICRWYIDDGTFKPDGGYDRHKDYDIVGYWDVDKENTQKHENEIKKSYETGFKDGCKEILKIITARVTDIISKKM